MRTGMSIGVLAGLTGVGIETVRFYEREGLLPEPPRSPAGYRIYDADPVRRVRFILKAKNLGFTLAETRELNRVRRALHELEQACAANRETGECPILTALDDEL